MKKRHYGWMISVVGLMMVFAASTSWAAATPKIGVVDAVGALQQSMWGKRATEELKKQAEKLDADLEAKQKAFGAKKEEFDKKQSVMDAKAKSQKEQELRDMQQDGQKFLMESKGKLNEMQAAVAKKVHEVVEKIAKDEKYDFVFEKTSMVYSSEKEDITKRVVTELDKLPPFRF